MTTDDEWQDRLEREPVFIASQMRPGRVLSEEDVTVIQAVLSEIDKQENDAVEVFQRGRIFGLREIGGDDMVDAVQRGDAAWIRDRVRKVMDKMNEQWGRPTLVDELRSALATALDDWEQHNGRLTDETDPHWSNGARNLLKESEGL